MTSVARPLPYAEDVESIPADEADDIRRVLAALEKLLERGRAKSGKPQPDVHVKADGCARGEFRVLAGLPAELAQGLFAFPRTFVMVARFSNAASSPQPDWTPDGRGLAIKLLDVEGERVLPAEPGGPSQDFIMINHPVFFARNVKDYLRLEQVLVDGNDAPLATLKGFLTGGQWNPLEWHWREAITVARIAGHLPSHPAGNTYFSMAPIRYGDYVAKYRVQPAGDRPDSILETVKRLASEPDALRLMLEETLRAQDIRFDFQVQLRTSGETMPVEDATVEWPESESPFRTVAQVTLPQQDLSEEAWQDSCRDLSFTVWNALNAHRALGGINRVRREAYRVSSEWRIQGKARS